MTGPELDSDVAMVFALVSELRRLGVSISTGEAGDALIAVGSAHTDIADLKHVLGACLAKTEAHRQIHDTVFDIMTANRTNDDVSMPGLHLDEADDDTLQETLATAVGSGNIQLQQLLARIYISRHAGFVPDRPSAGTLYVSRVLRAAGTEAIRARLLQQDVSGHSPAGLRRGRHHADEAMEGFERIVETEVRRRLVEDRGGIAVTRTVASGIPDDVDFLTAGAQEREALVPLVEAMARSIDSSAFADRAARPRGRIDVRATIRASAATGGVPLVLRHRQRPASPRTLIVLADVSGSVAQFAHFSLALTSALHRRFSRVRAFVFVDGFDEITSILAERDSLKDLAARLRDERSGLAFDGRTDYGQAFERLAAEAAATLDSRAIVLILGDARTNYFDPNTRALRAIKARVSRIWWLNPEGQASWGDGDSAATDYARECDAMIECRTARDLHDFVRNLI